VAETTRVPINFDSLPGVALEFESAGVMSGWKVFHDGVELKPTRNKLSVPLGDGSFAEIVVKQRMDMTPTLTHEGEIVAPMPGVPIGLMILGALPIALVGVGGAIGGGLGAAAFAGNMAIAQLDKPIALRVALMLVVGAAAVGLWAAIAAAIN
jgi:hypothetical protein